MSFGPALMFLGAALCAFVYWSWTGERQVAVTPDPELSIDAEWYGIVAAFGDRTWVAQVEGRTTP